MLVVFAPVYCMVLGVLVDVSRAPVPEPVNGVPEPVIFSDEFAAISTSWPLSINNEVHFVFPDIFIFGVDEPPVTWTVPMSCDDVVLSVQVFVPEGENLSVVLAFVNVEPEDKVRLPVTVRSPAVIE